MKENEKEVEEIENKKIDDGDEVNDENFYYWDVENYYEDIKDLTFKVLFFFLKIFHY